MGQRDKEGVTVSLHAHDPFGPNIPHLASAAFSFETLATDGATIDPDDAHTHRRSLVRLAFSYTAFRGNPRRERTPPLELLVVKNLGSLKMPGQ